MGRTLYAGSKVCILSTPEAAELAAFSFKTFENIDSEMKREIKKWYLQCLER